MNFKINYDGLYKTQWNPNKNINETVRVIAKSAQDAVKIYLGLKDKQKKESEFVQDVHNSNCFLVTAFTLNSFLKCMESMGCKDFIIVPFDFDKELGNLYLISIVACGKLMELNYTI